jgi:hypothetical protein
MCCSPPQAGTGSGSWAQFSRNDDTATLGDVQPLVNYKRSSGGGLHWASAGSSGRITVPAPGFYEIRMTGDVKPWTGSVTFRFYGFPADLGESTQGRVTHLVGPDGVLAQSITLGGVAEFTADNLSFVPSLWATDRSVHINWTVTKASSVFLRKLD